MTNQPFEITMELLTDDEKLIIDGAPDQTLTFLFNNILEHGAIPEYFILLLKPNDPNEGATIIKFEGDKVLAALDYIDYCVAEGKRKDPFDE